MPLDIGVGILLALFTAYLFHIHASLFFICVGVVFALLPDIDMLWYLFGKPAKHYDHRSSTHHPAFWIPIIVLTCILFGPLFGTLLLFGVAIHLIHDTIGLGWGIAWMWPISGRKFRFFSPTGNNGGWEFFRTWTPLEEVALAQQQHDPHWVRTYYLRPNIIGFVEYAVFLVGLAALYFYFI